MCDSGVFLLGRFPEFLILVALMLCLCSVAVDAVIILVFGVGWI